MSYNFDAAVSPFIKALPPSGLAKFLDIMAANPNIVPLSVGEPDFDIPQAVKDAEINSICEGKSCYTPTLGLLELRKAIADDIHKNYGVKYDPKTEIMVTVGVSEALYTTITTIMHPGDEIILPEPCYVVQTRPALFWQAASLFRRNLSGKRLCAYYRRFGKGCYAQN